MGDGLLHPITSLDRLKWIVTSREDQEPNPLEGYITSFVKFHRHGLRSPSSRFMEALLYHYGVELQHFSHNAISNATIFVAIFEGT